MRFIRFIIVTIELLLCYLLEGMITVKLPYSSIIPDLLIVIVVALAWMFGSNQGMIYGFLAGFLIDVTSGNSLGLAAFIYTLIGFLAGIFRKFYRKDDNVTPLALTFVGEFIYLSLYYFLNFVTRGRSDYGFMLKNVMLPKMVLTVLIAVFLYKLCQLSLNWSRRGEL